MPEEIEVETSELQETIDELHKERSEREAEERATKWTRYISLSTALLAVLAAIGALQSGDLVNEAMISQLKASDTWNEYQAARQKTHLYTVSANAVIDGMIGHANTEPTAKTGKWKPKSPQERTKEYVDQVVKEGDKAQGLSDKAKKYEEESKHQMGAHHNFARSVAFIQVAIALGAISALTKIKTVWFMSMLVGAAGIVYFVIGFKLTGL